MLVGYEIEREREMMMSESVHVVRIYEEKERMVVGESTIHHHICVYKTIHNIPYTHAPYSYIHNTHKHIIHRYISCCVSHLISISYTW